MKLTFRQLAGLELEGIQRLGARRLPGLLCALTLAGAFFGVQSSGVGGQLFPTVNAGSKTTPPTADIQFSELAKEAGLTAPNVWGGSVSKISILETTGNGVAFFDYDGDGWLDIYIGNGTLLQSDSPNHEPTGHLYHNNRNGTFTDVTARSGLSQVGWQTGVCVGDYDNDGWEDIMLTYWGQNRLFRNSHDGTFTDVTIKAGLKQPGAHWGTGCSFLDYDRDGLLDIFIANYVVINPKTIPSPKDAPSCTWKGMPVLCGPRGLSDGINALYHNNGDGTFADVSVPSGITKVSGKGFGVVSFDFDNDGWPDIYVANDSVPSLLFHNNHDGTFTEIGLSSGVAYNEDGAAQGGMGLAIADYDGDGWFDIFKTNFADEASNLYHNNGNGTFTDVGYGAGVATTTKLVSWGAGFADFDNDGWKDLLYVNGHVYPEVDRYKMEIPYRQPRSLFRNLGNGRFENVSSSAGPPLKEMFSSRGCAFGDFNNDGKIDVVIVNMNDRPSLWRNDTQTANNSVLVKLIGTKANRDAIGARVWVVTKDHTQMDEVHSGDSVMSMSDLRLHFGLGTAQKIDSLSVRWPTTERVDKFENLDPNQVLTIQEGSGVIRSEEFGSAK